MSSFQEQPRIRNLFRLKYMVRFLANYQDFEIHFCVDEPNLNLIPPIPPFDWKYTPYSNPKENLPMDAPVSLWKENYP